MGRSRRPALTTAPGAGWLRSTCWGSAIGDWGWSRSTAPAVPQRTGPAGSATRWPHAGLDSDDLAVVWGAGTVSGGEEAMGTLLARRPDVTAVTCHNDLMAIGALRALRAAGRRVPDRRQRRRLR